MDDSSSALRAQAGERRGDVREYECQGGRVHEMEMGVFGCKCTQLFTLFISMYLFVTYIARVLDLASTEQNGLFASLPGNDT